MNIKPTIDNISGRVYFAWHITRKTTDGKYLGLKDGRIAWSTVPIYFQTSTQASEALAWLLANKV